MGSWFSFFGEKKNTSYTVRKLEPGEFKTSISKKHKQKRAKRSPKNLKKNRNELLKKPNRRSVAKPTVRRRIPPPQKKSSVSNVGTQRKKNLKKNNKSPSYNASLQRGNKERERLRKLNEKEKIKIAEYKKSPQYQRNNPIVK